MLKAVGWKPATLLSHWERIDSGIWHLISGSHSFPVPVFAYLGYCFNGQIDIHSMKQRVILLGASNLTIGFPLVLKMLENGFPAPVEIHAAYGHGRSYGTWSRIFYRELPGIINCHLWDNVNTAGISPASTVALLTDVGNDLMYGADVSQILEWIEECLRRLAEQQSQIVLTLLPMSGLKTLSALRFHFARMIFFPKQSSSRPDLLKRAAELNERLFHVGSRYGVHFIEPPATWYGLDPIHIRRSRRKEAWRKIFSGWPSFGLADDSVHSSLKHRFDTWRFRPAQRRIRGRLQSTPQPVLQTERAILYLY